MDKRFVVDYICNEYEIPQLDPGTSIERLEDKWDDWSEENRKRYRIIAVPVPENVALAAELRLLSSTRFDDSAADPGSDYYDVAAVWLLERYERK